VSALPLYALAPAKINLGLFVGPTRADGRHELVSVMQSISLADELTLEWAGAEGDRAGDQGVVGTASAQGGRAGEQTAEEAQADDASGDVMVCAGVAGPPEENLAARALAAFRVATGWDGPPLRLTIVKRIPVAAGLGGGSADAAAALRLAAAASGLGDEELLRGLGAQLGADVPAQIAPGRWLATGAGERLQALPDPIGSLGVLVLPAAAALSTAAVYAAADGLGVGRTEAELAERERALRVAFELAAALPAKLELLHNDLEKPARSLCPEVGQALVQACDGGADVALLSGSGPTVLGLFGRANGLGRAQRAAAGLQGRVPRPLCATPVDADFARVRTTAIPAVGNN
jgi:4-diphosphocytidyl-2-C-methyl-D-erythritol kinase